MGRSPCCSKEGLNKGAWTAHEDKILREYIKVHGEGRWRNLPKRAGLKRCGKSCRLRWLNYLRPDIKRGNISSDEEELIIRLHKLLGNRWSLIAGRLPGRTDNEIKNYWNTNLGKKVKDGQQTNGNTQNPMPTTNASSLTLPKLDSNVVRTKATKWSKPVVFLYPMEAMTANDNEQEKDLSTDFNVGDVTLSDLLNTDFGCSNVVNNEVEQLSACSIFSDEFLEDCWTQTNFAEETNASNNL